MIPVVETKELAEALVAATRYPPHGHRGWTLGVACGEVVCVIGPSGLGKSTLLRRLNWLEVPEEGEIRSWSARCRASCATSPRAA